jgi:hypothetical protein
VDDEDEDAEGSEEEIPTLEQAKLDKRRKIEEEKKEREISPVPTKNRKGKGGKWTRQPKNRKGKGGKWTRPLRNPRSRDDRHQSQVAVYANRRASDVRSVA